MEGACTVLCGADDEYWAVAVAEPVAKTEAIVVAGLGRVPYALLLLRGWGWGWGREAEVAGAVEENKKRLRSMGIA